MHVRKRGVTFDFAKLIFFISSFISSQDPTFLLLLSMFTCVTFDFAKLMTVLLVFIMFLLVRKIRLFYYSCECLLNIIIIIQTHTKLNEIPFHN